MPVSRLYPEAPVLSVSILCRRGDKVALVKRAKEPFKDHWSLPGGKVELGETVDEAALRELLEETGLSGQVVGHGDLFDSIQRDDNGLVKTHYVLAMVLVDCPQGDLEAGDDAADARWATLEELDDLLITPKTPERIRRFMV